MAANTTPDPIDVHVGAKIRVRRKQLGMSQSALAESLGLTFQQVQKYERGANRVSASMLFKTSQKLEAPVSYFFEGLDGQSSSEHGSIEDLKALKAMSAVPAVALITELPRETQVLLGGLIKALVKE